MKPTKSQKLEWIERVLEIGEQEYLGYTCEVFLHYISSESFKWYKGAMAQLGVDGSHPFVSIPSYPTRAESPRNQARLMWLVFLHLWVEKGEVV